MKRLFVLFGVLVVGFSPGVANAATALIVGGKGRYAELTDEEMATAFGGYFAGYDDRISVPFPGSANFGYSVQVGADNLYDAVYATPGRKTIGGVSQGAPAVDEVLRRLMDDPDPPAPEELDAVMYAYPSPILFRYGGMEYRPLPETPYDILIVKAEYDGIADWPDNPANLLAVVNALMGAGQLHVPAAFTDLSDVPSEYITTTTNQKGGTTTSILIPTRILPLLKPLADKGSDDAVRSLDSILRPIVDSAYDRPRVTPLGVATSTAERPGEKTDEPGPAGLSAAADDRKQAAAETVAEDDKADKLGRVSDQAADDDASATGRDRERKRPVLRQAEEDEPTAAMSAETADSAAPSREDNESPSD
ncbi:PE-PPE domain-containing protein [Mycolicibacterium austroafricanum]|uniref:PE-PPE domain-containing protein n=1 Tax=Mycolicibacterium austroafricanum TaxID=39687 RepID=UPI001CA3849F|nr:PE-PPE domain-containing protein [Mycolicibacterium austroafricanum]QZT65111.1 PE-PPE domain-containing protein [Mycolicibacterium austroafricanum]